MEDQDAQWRAKYISNVPEFLKTTPYFLGEDATKWMREKGIGDPSNENAWGAMFNTAIIKSGFVIRTGRTKLATSPKSKGHAFRLWKSTICQPESLVDLNTELQQIKKEFHARKIDLSEALRRAAEAGASF